MALHPVPGGGLFFVARGDRSAPRPLRPALGERLEWREALEQVLAEAGESQALILGRVDEPGVLELVDALPEDARRDVVAARAQGAERRNGLPQLPEDAHRPAAAEEIQQQDDRPARASFRRRT